MNYKEIEENKIVWGCAFKADMDRARWRDNKIIHLKKKPVKGIIKDDYFFEVNKKDEIIKSSKVYCYSREYAYSYQDCVKIYNNLIVEKQKELKNTIEELNMEIIK